jgi:hypothetical protein
MDSDADQVGVVTLRGRLWGPGSVRWLAAAAAAAAVAPLLVPPSSVRAETSLPRVPIASARCSRIPSTSTLVEETSRSIISMTPPMIPLLVMLLHCVGVQRHTETHGTDWQQVAITSQPAFTIHHRAGRDERHDKQALRSHLWVFVSSSREAASSLSPSSSWERRYRSGNACRTEISPSLSLKNTNVCVRVCVCGCAYHQSATCAVALELATGCSPCSLLTIPASSSLLTVRYTSSSLSSALVADFASFLANSSTCWSFCAK